jgi:hypothetical protein
MKPNRKPENMLNNLLDFKTDSLQNQSFLVILLSDKEI